MPLEKEGFFMPEAKVGGEVIMPSIIAVIDLGPNDEGSISADHLPDPVLKTAVEATVRPDLQKKPTNRWRCVDGRLPEGGLKAPEGYSDPQLGGGLAVNETSVDIMTGEADSVLSATVARNTRTAIKYDQEVVVHGDNHVQADAEGKMPETNKEGCGANKFQREVLRKNAQNAEIVAPTIFEGAKLAGLTQYWATEDDVKDEINELITTGGQKADDDSFWDAAPVEVADIIVENGGTYEELIENHGEVLAKVELETETTLDEEAFMETIQHEGKPLEAFVASIGVYAKYIFDRAAKEGKDDQWAARRVLATLLAQVGTLKKLTKNIPVVITK